MAINFCRHQIMEKLGIEQLPVPVEIERLEPKKAHNFELPIRPQQVGEANRDVVCWTDVDFRSLPSHLWTLTRLPRTKMNRPLILMVRCVTWW
jgi:hypothetical protein